MTVKDRDYMAFCRCRSEWRMSSWPQIERTPEGRVSAFRWLLCKTSNSMCVVSDVTPQPFYGPFLGAPGWAGARRELLDFMVQGRLTGRHTDHLAGCHSIWTTSGAPQYLPFFKGQMPFLLPNQQCQSTESNHRTLSKGHKADLILLTPPTGSAGEGCHVCLYAMIIQLQLIGFSVPESMLSVVWIKIV